MTDERFDVTFLNAGAASPRIDVYGLLSSLLMRPPTAGRLAQLTELDFMPDIPSSLTRAVTELKAAADRADADAVAREYNTLFVGIGRGEVVPFASGYKDTTKKKDPLAEIREDLAALRVERRGESCDTEDHAAALCEIMVLLIAEPQVPAERQAAFFNAHLAPWMRRFFQDLQEARAADFYRYVGRLGETFMRLEEDLLEDR